MAETSELSVAVLSGDGDFRESLIVLLQQYLHREILVASTRDESLTLAYTLGNSELHGAFIGEFDITHEGLRTVVDAVDFAKPEAFKIAMVYGKPETVPHTGADIKVSNYLVAPNIQYFLNEIAQHADEHR